MISKWTVAVFMLLSVTCICPVHAVEEQEEGAAVGKDKEEILGRIDTVEQGLKITRKCVSEAKTPAEIDRCYELTKIQKFEAVLDMIFEMGSSWEERRYRRMLPEKW